MTSDEEQASVARHVTITGTRSVPAESQLPGLFDDYLRPFAAPDAHFYLGGAVGIDTAALDWLAENSHASLTVVVPCKVADQPVAAAASIHRQRDAGRLAEVVELGADRLGTAAYYARNRWMVDRSSFVIGFPRGADTTSGTWYTVNYAAQQGKPRLIAPV
jgi:predicted Rossmann fold nucleotide-binding protein DprA/Smf involved in DNA uptake